MFATAESSVELVNRLGFEATPVGPNWLEGSDDPISSRLLAPNNRGHSPLLVEIASMGAIPQLVEICASWRPNAILSEQSEFAGRLAGELAGIPVAVQLVANPPPRTVVGALIAAKLDDLRVSVGLPRDPELRQLFGQLYLDCVPPSLTLPGVTLLPIARKVRPMVFDTSGEETLPSWIDRLPNQPIVYATLGTVFNRTSNVLETIIEGPGERTNEPHRHYRPQPRSRSAWRSSPKRPCRAIHPAEPPLSSLLRRHLPWWLQQPDRGIATRPSDVSTATERRSTSKRAAGRRGWIWPQRRRFR